MVPMQMTVAADTEPQSITAYASVRDKLPRRVPAAELYSGPPRSYAGASRAARPLGPASGGSLAAHRPGASSAASPIDAQPANGGAAVKRNLHAGRPSSGGLSLNVFTEAELDDIHLSSLEVLERTGVWVEADDALAIFKDGGCPVDRETRMVRIPPHLVEEAIRSAPPKNYLCGRDPDHDIVLEAGRVYFSNFDEGIMVVDLRTGEYRHPVLDDVHDAARLVDALPDIDTY